MTEKSKMNKPYFPLFVDLSGKDILFVGGGSIAARRITVLQPFADQITVIAPEADERIESLANQGGVTWNRRRFQAADISGRDLVLAATDDQELNAEITSLCREAGIPANASSDKELCDFFFPGIVRQGQTVIGVSASGEDHRKARRVRERIQEILTEEGIL